MYRDRADSTKAFMERWSGSDAKVAQITRWPHHVTATNLMRDIEDIFVPIANATRAFDPATIKRLIAQHELVVAVSPGGLVPLKGIEHLWPPTDLLDTTVLAFWCATDKEAAELQRVYCSFPGDGRSVEQRLKAMMILPIDYDHIDDNAAERLRVFAASRPPKPAPMMMTFGRCCGMPFLVSQLVP
jgi:hypothetical protein